jgi:arabinogalactan endo-1,4-beta-galactosidase
MKALSDRAQTRYHDRMTKLLEQGIQAVRELSAERQDLAGELLLTLATGNRRYGLTPEQMEDLKLAIQEADRGEFASAGQIADTWKKFGL